MGASAADAIGPQRRSNVRRRVRDMLSARGLFEEIHQNDEAFRPFCSIAMCGESQGGWENGRTAALVADPVLAPKIARHGADEDKHLAYCHEELLRLAKDGRRAEIDAILRSTAHAEIKLYRDVSLAVVAHMGRILGWSRAKSAVLAAGIHGLYVYERLGGWRRMTSLHMPKIRNALGGPAQPAAMRRVPTRTA
jgi:hypothetical protein